MADLFPISRADKLAEIRREIAMRKAVYGRQVTASSLSQAVADRRIEIMEAIAADYERGGLKIEPAEPVKFEENGQ